jgi:pimeloyl-ACP methyl ester carboxylesterase
MLRLLLLCLIATGSTLNLFSQTSPYGYAKAVDELLVNVDKSGITSGLLYDRAYPSARLDLFNQMGMIDTTSPSHFGQAYYELFQAAYNNAPFVIGVDSLDDKVSWHNFYNQIPIGIIDCNMQQINPEAYTNRWVNINNDIVTNAPGETTDIYITKHPQVVCPMFNKAKAGRYQLLLEPWMVFSNTGLQVSSIEININGNTTYLAMGDKVDIELFEGDNLMQMHVYFTDGSSFTNMVKISTTNNSSFLARTSANDAPPCFEMEVKATIPYKGYNENRFIKGKNKLSFYYADCNNQVLRKPVIILDGLDPEDKRNGEEIYNKWFNYFDYSGTKVNLAKKLRENGFDVVIVNMPEFIDDDCPTCPPIMAGSDYIQRNAMVLVEIINQLNQQLVAAGSTEKLVIVGPSMGGQISRYALTYMEQNNMTHNCRLWISFDSPHLGANLPIGLQHYINEMANMGSKDALKSRRINLEVPATREQLLDYAAAHNGFVDIEPKQDPMFTAYYNEQNTQGIPDPNNGNLVGWPVNCRKISMISGALNGYMQEEGRPSDIALRTKTRVSNAGGWAIGAMLSN